MSWIKKDSTVEVNAELEYENNRLDKTDAFEVTITEAYLKESATEGSKSVSLVIEAKDDADKSVKTYFTIMGRDGETFYTGSHKGKSVKKQHFGLTRVNTLFSIALGKEIFDCEPDEVAYKVWNKDDKEMEDAKGDGFSELIGKKVGICHQMKREIDGADSKEYGEIAHFFNLETGLFDGEVDSDNRKLDKWINSKKEFIVTEVEVKKSSFGKKKEEESSDDKPKSRWAR